MSETSQALEFTNIKLSIQVDGDLPGDEQLYPIHNMVQLRLALNRLELDEDDVTLQLTGKTQDGHTAQFRLYNHPKKGSPWYWGYVSFVLDKLDSQAERLLQKIRSILN